MADTQTTVALNIGSQRVSMAVFEPSKSGGLILKSYEAVSALADPATDPTRVAQVRVEIAELVKKLKVSGSKVRYAISGQSVFTRFVKLPPLQDDNVEQLVTFEAKQHVPFPINEVVWDYELFESAGEKEVILVAIKGDALDEINQAVNDCGLVTGEVDVAPTAIYNAYRAAYPDTSEPVLLIDIGAKTSNLLYIEGNRFFTRSVAIGGVALTTAISKEYGISFAEAEHQKIDNGLVALGGGHTEQMDEALAALAMVIRNSLTRLPAEIARTTNYYRSQHGGGANLHFIREFFEEKLHLPVEFFNPLQAVTIGKNINLERLQHEAHLMGELVGLGLRGVGKSKINIDLVPATVELRRASDRRKPWLISAAAVLVAGTAAFAGLEYVAANKAKEESRKMAEAKENLDKFQTPIKSLLKKEDQVRVIADSYASLESDRTFWIDLISETQAAFASDAVWLTSMEPLHGYKPVLGKDEKPEFKSAVKGEFINPAGSAIAGASLLQDIQPEETQPAARGKKQAGNVSAQDVAPAVNALRIKGFWRENPKSQNVVSDLLKRLRDNPAHFRFTVDEGKTQVPLKDEQIIRQLQSSPEQGEFAGSFEIILPLAREVSIK
jgi:type IV pilus assembly protein PilM